MALLTVRNASFAYEGHTVAEGISFSVNEGDYVCVVGENGSGKSTLIKGIVGLKQPSSGTIELSIKRSTIGYLPQQTVIQKDFPASVYEVVLSGTLNSLPVYCPFYTAAARKKARSSMERLGIYSIKNESFRFLSGGQQQRVLLARALCAADKLIVMDEPVAGLDPIVTGELYSLISGLHKEGMTIVMISHDVRAAVDSATHILHLKKAVQFFGTAKEYAESELGIRYLGGDGHVCHHG